MDLSSAGRGAQQTLLLLSYLYANPGTILLLDEPDAHLEILRQRQTYNLIREIADSLGSQIIVASHSEVVLNEAAYKDIVIAFLGAPHRIDDRGSQLLKSLRDIGWEQYYQAEQKGWVLYLEGSSDLAILSAFADKLNHPAKDHLKSPFVYYIQQPTKVREHFWGIKEAKNDLKGMAIFDHDKQIIEEKADLIELKWNKNEMENYLCIEEALIAYAKGEFEFNNMFEKAKAVKREGIMRQSIKEVSEALKTLKKPDSWSPNIKASDDFLDPLFEKYFEKLGLPNLLKKSNYHELVKYVPGEKIDREISEKLYKILEIAEKTKVQ